MRNNNVKNIITGSIAFLVGISILYSIYYSKTGWYDYRKNTSITNQYIDDRAIPDILKEVRIDGKEKFVNKLTADQFQSSKSRLPFEKEYYRNTDFAVIGLAEHENGTVFTGGGHCRFVAFTNFILIKDAVYVVNSENLYQLIKPNSIYQFIDLIVLINKLIPMCGGSNVISIEDEYLRGEKDNECKGWNKYNLAIKFKKNLKGNYEFKYYSVSTEYIYEERIEAVSSDQVRYSSKKIFECKS